MPASRPPAWYLLSLRGQGEHAALRRAAARHGAGLLPLSPWRIEPRQDTASREALEQALHAPVVVFTSPAAVRAAAALRPLAASNGQHWLAVGAGTAAALHRAGIATVQAPERMDSEGLLAMPALAAPALVGLVTAPGGRGLLAPTLADRGAQVVRADVYARMPVPLRPAALARLDAAAAPLALALSSEDALRRVLAQLPEVLAVRLRDSLAVAAGPRLAGIARELGWERVVVAGSPRPAALARAAAAGLATKV